MKKRNRWFYIIIVLLALYLCFFYMDRTEIGDVDIIRVLGMEQNGDRYRISALYNNNGGADAESGDIVLVDGEGRSIYEAYNDMVRKNKRNVSIAHTTYYLINTRAAEHGLHGCLDFIERDPTVKMNAMVYLMDEVSIYDYLKKSVDEKVFLHDEIAAISQKEEQRLKKVDNTISQVVDVMNSPTENLLLPYLVADKDRLYINGYGVFREDVFYDYLDYETSLAVDLFRNRLKSCPIYLDNIVGLEITDMNIGKRSNIENGLLTLHLEMDFESDIKEVASSDSVYDDYYLERIDEMQRDYVIDMLNEVLDYSAEHGVDLLEVGKLVRTRYPADWDTIANDFYYYLEHLRCDYDIQSQTAQSYLVAN